MWKPLIYLDSSIFSVLHPSNKALIETKAISLELLSKCKEEEVFKGYTSPFLFIELEKQYGDLTFLFELLGTYDIHYLTFNLPLELDDIANGLANSKVLPERNAFDYFHLSVCAYLQMEYFATWDRVRLNNFDAGNKILRARFTYHHPHKYRVVNPAFLTGKEHTESVQPFFKQSLLYKKEVAKLFDEIEFGKRTTKAQELTATVLSEIKKRAISIIETPTEQMLRRAVHQVPKYEDIPLQYEFRNYDEEIDQHQFPLLDYKNEHLEPSCMHDFRLYHYTITDGEDLLKAKMIESYMPLSIDTIYYQVLTAEKAVEGNKQQKANFLNWLLPQLLSSIEDDDAGTHEEIKKDDFHEVGSNGIDQAVLQLLMGKENIRPLKDTILTFTDFLTDGNWNNYRGYISNVDWPPFMQNMINNSLILINKEAKDIWLILVGIDCG